MNWARLDQRDRDAWMRARQMYYYINLALDGATQAHIKQFFNLTPGGLESALCSMERYGFLLYQDDEGGRLHTFRNTGGIQG